MEPKLLLCFVYVLFCVCHGQIQYYIPEEMKHGTVVGSIANDIGLDLRQMSYRKFRINSRNQRQYFKLSEETGALIVNDRIDREQLCEASSTCNLILEVFLENPFKIYRIVVNISDVNDNDPVFPSEEFSLQILESTTPGARFPLPSAFDADIGSNSVKKYELSPSDHFLLDVQTRDDGTEFLELVLKKAVDREQQSLYDLLLVARDGGLPSRSGSIKILVLVLDANDNAPYFDKSSYTVSLLENAAVGSLVIKLNASDLDEGMYGEIDYSVSSHTPVSVQKLFKVNSETGEMRLNGAIDFEKTRFYKIYVFAKDKAGLHSANSKCEVSINIIDLNDNTPEITFSSFLTKIPEDATLGTIVALIDVSDKDSGSNGVVYLKISGGAPFKLSRMGTYYSLVTSALLDREAVSQYNLTVTATDGGTPSLTSQEAITIHIEDINDNPPVFERPVYEVYISENNAPGVSIISIKASDPDYSSNGAVFYSISDVTNQGKLMPNLISINPDNGNIYGMRSFDYEKLRELNIAVIAQDKGSPPLSSKAIVNLFIKDENDNPPRILYPSHDNGPSLVEIVPPNANSGCLITKVVAVDADSGQNAWLSYQVSPVSDLRLFKVGFHTGEIRTVRNFTAKDALMHNLVVFVKDNGHPSLTSTANFRISVSNTVHEALVESLSEATNENHDLTFYLVISLVVVSLIFVITIVTAIVCKTRRPKDLRLPYNSQFADFHTSTQPLPSNYFSKVYVSADTVKENGTIDGLLEFDNGPGNASRNGETWARHEADWNKIPLDGQVL
ncbi:protocadherin alpha-C2-like [Protopterus annectens]|uniref:protocadherin alpha-C2-like n=1 Tax=Protopterus annectens TaxID=7888 RepID=UPI001CFA28EA|nr:protocadherin alpha-C2-like [Protopterus annectens]